MNVKEFIKVAIEASIKAGEVIMDVYNSGDYEVEFKSDSSPLTLADRKSQDVINSYLKDTGIPVLSEEGKQLPYSERKEWEWLWVVDPLDGTKEFIKRNGEFTVNIALVKRKETIAGVIFVPTKNDLYFSDGESSYYAKVVHGKVGRFEKLPLEQNKQTNKLIIVASRSHLNEETKLFIEEVKKNSKKDVDTVSAGSSLKFCLIATGYADLYPRYAPTMEWDTAAGHAIVKTAGFNVYNIDTNKELEYNKEDLHNPYFIVK
jgi:3'(2'), 5'-bisphosphate nucleotidase